MSACTTSFIDRFATVAGLFAERHFAERHFAERAFCRRTFCRTDILPNGHFAERTFYRTDSLPKVEISSELYRFAYTVKISVIIKVIVEFDDRNFDSEV
jgi:hypothetical protein